MQSSSSRKTSSVCWPSIGGGRSARTGVLLNLMGLASRTQAALLAVKEGLVQPR